MKKRHASKMWKPQPLKASNTTLRMIDNLIKQFNRKLNNSNENARRRKQMAKGMIQKMEMI